MPPFSTIRRRAGGRAAGTGHPPARAGGGL